MTPPPSPAPHPSLPFRFTVGRHSTEVFALLDTGFDGHFAIPAAVARQLPPPAYVRRVCTASGQIVRVPVYYGTVELVNQPGPIRALPIALGDEYLLAIATLNHFSVTFDHGQRVIVTP